MLIILVFGRAVDARTDPVIEQITIEGNVLISTERLLDLMVTRPAGLVKKRRFNPAVFRADIKAIENFYENSGFLDVRARPFRDLLDNEKRVRIRIVIDEGPRYIVHAVNIIGNHYLADELANETFLRAYRALSTFRGRSRGEFRSFLLSIAGNLLRDHYRGHTQRAVQPVSRLGCGKDVNSIDYAEYSETSAHEGKERRAMLAQALASLPDHQAKLIRLSHLKQLKAEQIAAILGKPSPEAVRSALCRAMKNLREALIRQGYFDQVSA